MKAVPVVDPGPDPDVFDLNEDGTISLRFDSHEALLRRPTIGELEILGELCERAATWLAENKGIGKALSKSNPCPAMYVKAITLLGDHEVARGELPSWCVHTGPMNDMILHWYQSPLVRSSVRAIVAEALAKGPTPETETNS